MTVQMLSDLTYDRCATLSVGCTSQVSGDSEIDVHSQDEEDIATRTGEKRMKKIPDARVDTGLPCIRVEEGAGVGCGVERPCACARGAFPHTQGGVQSPHYSFVAS